MINMLLVTLLCAACGGESVGDAQRVQLAAANPSNQKSEVPVSSTNNAFVVTDGVDADGNAALSIKDVLKVAVDAIDGQPATPAGEVVPDIPVVPSGPVLPGGPSVPAEPEVPTAQSEMPTEAGEPEAPKEPEPTPIVDSSQPEPNGAAEVSFTGFNENGLASEHRAMFGCGGNIGEGWMSVATSWETTWNVSSRSEFDNAISNMQAGDRILISSGTNLGSVDLASSGSSNAKKYISGESHCGDTGGATTFSSTTRFNITGDDWVLMNMKFKPTGSTLALTISGSRNWIYNNRIDRAGEVRFKPEGTASVPTTVGNRVVGNYFNGANDAVGIGMASPFSNKNAPSVYDLVIGGNTFEDYQEGDYLRKVITGVGFGHNFPYGSATDLAGADTFIEIGWNHFLNCIGEVPSSKTRRWMIHNNLMEATSAYNSSADTMHINLRHGDDKLVFNNILLDNGSRLSSKSINISGERSYGYYNVSQRSGNHGFGLAWTVALQNSRYTGLPQNTFSIYERITDIDWRYNFFLGDGGDVSKWARFTIISGFDTRLPPVNNSIQDNFYTSSDPDSIGFGVKDHTGSSGLDGDSWESNNPDATRQLQHFALRSGNNSTLDSSVNIPTKVTVRNFWLNGADVTFNMPPWINKDGNGLVQLTD